MKTTTCEFLSVLGEGELLDTHPKETSAYPRPGDEERKISDTERKEILIRNDTGGKYLTAPVI